MYGAVQAIGNLDIDTIDRYQAVKRKATKIIQKCNELLDTTGRGVDSGSANLMGPQGKQFLRKQLKGIRA